MFLFNLSLVEFLAVFTAVSGLVVALYLLSRSRRKLTVPTLRFWVHARQPVPAKRRRRIQQPWSLILQLVSLALLLLAIAQLRLGNRDTAFRDHVLLLDASSWTAARSSGHTLLDEAKQKARAFVRALPGTDRVMLVRVDALASPATGMETDRAVIERAIGETRPGASALDLDQAFLFAEQIRRLHGSNGGEIVYAGPGRVGGNASPAVQPSRLRVLSVDSPDNNVGLSKIGLRRSDGDPEVWDVFVAVRNYGSAPRRVPLALQFGGAPVGATLIDMKPGATENRTFHLRTRAAGWIEARLLVKDALEEDNRAILELPALKAIKVAVYTDNPDAIRPALTAHPQIEASYYSRSEYRPDTGAQIVILDRFAPSPLPDAAVIWIEPPDSSPFKTRTRLSEVRTLRWHPDHEVSSGIRSRSLRVANAQILAAAKDDVIVAEVDGGPVALLRPVQRMAALGFNPGSTDMRFDLVTPLLLANLLRWVAPDVFRASEVHGGSVGTVTTPVDRDTDTKQLRVLADTVELPFTLQSGSLRFFAGSPGVVRVLTGNREQVHSLSLPEVGERVWSPPGSARKGIPGVIERAASRDLWQILAVLGTLGLLAEWMLYGRKRSASPELAIAAAASGRSWWRKAS